jgi:hypothetical protein
MKKPKVLTKCVANHYAAPNERIIEFTNEVCGGLIGLRTMPDGSLAVNVYQQDATVSVTVSKPSRAGRTHHPKGGKVP